MKSFAICKYNVKRNRHLPRQFIIKFLCYLVRIKKTIEFKVIFLFNTTVSGIYIIFMKIQLNPFQDTLINYSCRSSMNKF